MQFFLRGAENAPLRLIIMLVLISCKGVPKWLKLDWNSVSYKGAWYNISKVAKWKLPLKKLLCCAKLSSYNSISISWYGQLETLKELRLQQLHLHLYSEWARWKQWSLIDHSFYLFTMPSTRWVKSQVIKKEENFETDFLIYASTKPKRRLYQIIIFLLNPISLKWVPCWHLPCCFPIIKFCFHSESETTLQELG